MYCKCGCKREVKKGNTWIKGHHNRGKIWSEESRKKLSESQKESSYFHIYNKTKEHSIKASESNKNRGVSEETKAKIAKSLLGFKHSEETKKKMSKFRKERLGDLSPGWKGGISGERKYGFGWSNRLKTKIKNRDNNTCQSKQCKNRSKILEIHHKNFNKKDNRLYNLITLCSICHKAIHRKRKEKT